MYVEGGMLEDSSVGCCSELGGALPGPAVNANDRRGEIPLLQSQERPPGHLIDGCCIEVAPLLPVPCPPVGLIRLVKGFQIVERQVPGWVLGVLLHNVHEVVHERLVELLPQVVCLRLHPTRRVACTCVR